MNAAISGWARTASGVPYSDASSFGVKTLWILRWQTTWMAPESRPPRDRGSQ